MDGCQKSNCSYTSLPSEGKEETFGSDGRVYYLQCGDGVLGVNICPRLSGSNTSNTGSVLYVNYTSMKLLFKMSGVMAILHENVSMNFIKYFTILYRGSALLECCLFTFERETVLPIQR